ncbi:hypothetical protein AAVH_18650 [Aphelenchoides avenae]|nr:hypothetical protein AAVH_18650 [Aphelenchus avenae]
MGLEWIYAFAHPEPLFPYPVMLGRAIASTIIVPDVLAKLYVDFAIALIICSYYCTMLLFLFRYCQTVDNWCHKLLSYRSYGIGISVVLLMFAFGSIIGPLHSQWGSREEMLAYAREQDTVVYEKMLTSSFVGFVRNESNAYLIAGVFATILGSAAGAVIALSAFGCYYFLARNRRKFSSRTITLYRTLINALVTDAALAFFMVFVPLLTSMASFQFQWGYSSTTVLVSITIALWYPVCTHLVLLTYVKPYRNAVLEIVRFSTGFNGV